MIRQSAFIDVKKHLKGGLHCHTTRSDGAVDPAEVIRLHKANGYDFLALTDHRKYNFTDFAPEAGLTIIPGMEMDRKLPETGIHWHHAVCIGPEKQDGNPYEQDQTFHSQLISTQAEFQEMLDWLHADKQLTFYCHPQWSGVGVRDFDQLTGNFAMEIWNSGSAMDYGTDTDNGIYWDELLAQGKRIWAVAVDDGHAPNHHCKGWVMVNSENNVPAIEKALSEGKFYASCGPEIYDFYVEDGVAHIECSPVSKIQLRHYRGPHRMVQAEEGQTVTSGDIKLRFDYDYVRAVVIDEQGRKAWTNPIFLHD